MTKFDLMASMLWAAVACYAIAESGRLVRRWLVLKEGAPRPSETIAIPDDLYGLAMEESERHAQDSTLDAIKDSYRMYGSWNKVRAAIGVAPRDGET